MTRKTHLKKTTATGPVCQGGNVGASLRGEHASVDYARFKVALAAGHGCNKCAGSTLFAFLTKKEPKAPTLSEGLEYSLAAGEWEPMDWEEADARLLKKK